MNEEKKQGASRADENRITRRREESPTGERPPDRKEAPALHLLFRQGHRPRRKGRWMSFMRHACRASSRAHYHLSRRRAPGSSIAVSQFQASVRERLWTASLSKCVRAREALRCDGARSSATAGSCCAAVRVARDKSSPPVHYILRDDLSWVDHRPEEHRTRRKGGLPSSFDDTPEQHQSCPFHDPSAASISRAWYWRNHRYRDGHSPPPGQRERDGHKKAGDVVGEAREGWRKVRPLTPASTTCTPRVIIHIAGRC